MPAFRITSPSGRTFQINAPDGATEAEAIDYARNYLPDFDPKSSRSPLATGAGTLADPMRPDDTLGFGDEDEDDVYERAPIGAYVLRGGKPVQRDASLFENVVGAGKRGAAAAKEAIPRALASSKISGEIGRQEGEDAAAAGDDGMGFGARAANAIGGMIGMGDVVRPSRPATTEQRDISNRNVADAAGVLAESQRNIGKVSEETEELRPQSVRKLDRAMTGWETVKAITDAPMDTILNVGVESGVQFAPAMLAGLITKNPGVVAATAGGSSSTIEFANGITDYAARQGVDPEDTDAMKAFLADSQNASDALNYAKVRAGIVGSVDALTGPMGKYLTFSEKALAGVVKREAANIGAQTIAQMTAGAGGEAAAQYATTGEINAKDVILEAAGELVTTPGEVAGFALERGAERAVDAAARREARRAAVDAGELSVATASVEDMLDESREGRAVPLENKARQDAIITGTRSKTVGSRAGSVIDDHLAELDRGAGDGRMETPAVRALVREREELDTLVREQDRLVKEGVIGPVGSRLTSEERQIADTRRAEITSTLEKHRTALGSQRQAELLREKLGKIDADNDLISLAEQLRPGFDTPIAPTTTLNPTTLPVNPANPVVPAAQEAPQAAPVAAAPSVATQPAAPAAAPQDSMASLLEQHRTAVANANDKNRPPEQRRVAKKEAQYLMARIEQANTADDQGANALLDQAAAGTQATTQPMGSGVEPSAQVAPAPLAASSPQVDAAPAPEAVVIPPPAGTTPMAKRVPMQAAVVERAAAKVKGAPAVTVQAFAELPVQAREALLRQGAKPNEVPALMFNGRIFLVADNIRSEADVAPLMQHENTHVGLRQKYGTELQNRLLGLADNLGGLKGVLRMAKSQGIDLGDYVTGLAGDTTLSEGMRLAAITEELIAHVAETSGRLRAYIEAAIGAFRELVRDFTGDRAFKGRGITDVQHEARGAMKAAQTERVAGTRTDTRAKLGKAQQDAENSVLKAALEAADRGNFIEAATRAATQLDTDKAPPTKMNTPERKAFAAKAHPSMSFQDERGETVMPTWLHGAASAKSAFRTNPKVGSATFFTRSARFAAPYMGAALFKNEASGGRSDIIVDGTPVSELIKSPDPVDSIFGQLIKKHGEDFDAMREEAQGDLTAYANGAEVDMWLQSQVEDKIDIAEGMAAEDPGFIATVENARTAGMNTFPVNIGLENPFDFGDEKQLTWLMGQLQDKYKTAPAMGKAMDMKNKFESWDDVRTQITKSGNNWGLIEDANLNLPAMLREAGHDGYFVTEEGNKNLAVMDVSKIKSIFNKGPMGMRPPTAEEAADMGMTVEEALAEQQNFNIMLARGLPFPQGFNTLQQKLGSMFSIGANQVKKFSAWFDKALLDEFVDLRTIQKALLNSPLGATLTPQQRENMDAYGRENLRHGAFQDERGRAEERFIAPIARALSKADVSQDEFSDYLWWRHAPERDAYLRSHASADVLKRAGADGFAGISPADAQAAIAALDPTKLKAMKRAAMFVDGMRNYTLDELVASGQITPQHRATLKAQYQYYVPLRGMPDGSELLNGGKGRGLSMDANPIGKRAMGRKSKPDNILEQMVSDLDRGLVGKQKQRVLESLVRMIALNPDPNLWEINPVKAERKWVNGQLQVAQRRGSDNDEVIFMHRGIPVSIDIKDEGLRNALLNMDKPLVSGLRRIGRVTRWLSAIKTMWSPFFLLVNPVRDAGMASMALMAEHDAATIKNFGKFYIPSIAALRQDQKRKPGTSNKPIMAKAMQYAREFGSAGGKTGYTYVADIREQQKKLSSLMTRHAKSKGMADIMAGNFDTKDAALLARKAGQHAMHLIAVTNDMAENGTRLAVFSAMREKGMSVNDAAKYAKEVTVNFNRRGAWSQNIGSLYMFFNAAVQGSARLVKLMGNKRFAGTMGGLFAVSYAMALGQMMAAGDDDDGESLYDKAASDKANQRSIPIYLGDGRTLNLPVPYGPNMFTYAGYRIAKMQYDLMRDRPAGNVTTDIVKQMMTSMSPIDPGKGIAAMVPEIARAPIQAALNTNDFGSKISPKLDPFDKTNPANYTETDDRTGSIYKLMAAALNNSTGGDAYDGGFLNMTGEQVRFITEQYTGGPGRLVTDSYELIENLFAGVDPEPSDVPLANVYLKGSSEEKRTAAKFYDNMADYDNTVADWKKAIERGDQDKLNELVEDAPWVSGAEADASTAAGRLEQEGTIMQRKRQTDKALKELRKAKSAVFADDTLDRSEKAEQMKEIDLQMEQVQRAFTTDFNAVRGYQTESR